MSQLNIPSGSDNFTHYKDWIDHYSGGLGVKITFDTEGDFLMAMSNDIKTPELFINPKRIQEELNFTEEETLFALFHELEHAFENITLRSTPAGEQLYQTRIARLSQYEKPHSNPKLPGSGKALHTLENILRDIHVNNNIVSERKIPVLLAKRKSLYKTKLFTEHDFINPKPVPGSIEALLDITKPLPKHIQFLYACIRELMVPDEPCIIDPEIRIFLQRIRLSGTLRRSTESGLMDRLPAIWKEIEPQYLKWYEEDLEEQVTEEQEEDGSKKKDKNKQKGESEQQESSDDNEGGNDEGGKGEKEGKDGENGNDGNDGKNTKKKGKPSSSSKGKVKDFSDYYERGSFPHATEKSPEKKTENDKKKKNNQQKIENDQKDSDDQDSKKQKKMITDPKKIEEKLRKILEKKIAEQSRTPANRGLEKRARDMPECNDDNIHEIIKELEQYDEYVKNITKNENLIEQIVKIFERIRSRRMKPVIKSRGPVREDWSDGNFHPASIASGVSALLSGDMDPEMYMTRQIRLVEKKFVGNFRLRFISDGSGSMQGKSNIEQKKAVISMFEALSRISDLASQYKNDLTFPLQCSFDGRFFHGHQQVEVFKKLSLKFTDSDRIKSTKILDIASGGNYEEFAAKEILQDIKNNPELLDDMQSGKTKEIIMIMTDGGADDFQELMRMVNALRKCGAIVYGIDMGGNGDFCRDYYGATDSNGLGRGIGCPDITDLPKVLTNILIHHLDQI